MHLLQPHRFGRQLQAVMQSTPVLSDGDPGISNMSTHIERVIWSFANTTGTQ
jgi:hypothetical protein